MPSFKNRQNECVTTVDGRKIWAGRNVAVVGIVYCITKTDVKFIIEKRGTAQGLDKQGCWCLPCGYLDYNETGGEAIWRELWEEVGIDIKDRFPSIDVENIQPDYVKTTPDENRQNVTLRYSFEMPELVKLTPNNDCEPNEVADALWISIEDIEKYNFAFNHEKIIKEYYEKINKVISGVCA